MELTIADLVAARNRADLLIQGLREFQAGCDGTAGPSVILPKVAHETVIHSDAGQAVLEHCRSLKGQKPKAQTKHLPDVPHGTGKQAIKARKLGERPSAMPMARADARPTAKPGNPTTQAFLDDKPQTLGKAMKVFIRAQSGGFTGEQMRDWLLADKDYTKLLEQSSPGAVAANLTYWAEQKYLTRVGEKPLDANYTVTAAGKEWFSK